jgi:hypothetical protein
MIIWINNIVKVILIKNQEIVYKIYKNKILKQALTIIIIKWCNLNNNHLISMYLILSLLIKHLLDFLLIILI